MTTPAATAVLRGVRVLMPNWKVTLVRPSKELPANQVTFHIDPRYVFF
jgi:hypothetical protein